MDKLEERMDLLETRMDRLEERMDALEARMDKLEENMDSLENREYKSEDRLDKTEEQRRIDSNNIAQILYLQAEMLKILKDNLNMQIRA